MDRLQIIVVAKNMTVLQLFISRMPKMCAILILCRSEKEGIVTLKWSYFHKGLKLITPSLHGLLFNPFSLVYLQFFLFSSERSAVRTKINHNILQGRKAI